jgi:sec-independent protein translocase protein TatC
MEGERWERALRRMTVEEHLTELRNRLVVSLVAIAPIFLALFFLHRPVLDLLLRAARPYVQHLVFLSPQEAFFTYLRVDMVFSLALASPVWLYEALAFVLPAFGPTTRRTILRLLPTVVLLFLVGLGFGYFVFLPAALHFLLNFGQGLFVSEITLQNYVSFLLASVIPFGFLFEIPALAYVLAQAEVLTSSFMRRGRRVAIFVAAVLAAAFSPPGPMPMLLMGVPIVLLYEIAVYVVGLVELRRARRRAVGVEAVPPGNA